jgi:hypothetical protein
MFDRKATTCYSGLMIKVGLRHWCPLLEEDTLIDFPTPQLVQERKKKVDVE